ncbi:uncharacterized protein ACIQIH_013098 isoform 1-T1 [Cyanocitta cristata]
MTKASKEKPARRDSSAAEELKGQLMQRTENGPNIRIWGSRCAFHCTEAEGEQLDLRDGMESFAFPGKLGVLKGEGQSSIIATESCMDLADICVAEFCAKLSRVCPARGAEQLKLSGLA